LTPVAHARQIEERKHDSRLKPMTRLVLRRLLSRVLVPFMATASSARSTVTTIARDTSTSGDCRKMEKAMVAIYPDLSCVLWSCRDQPGSYAFPRLACSPCGSSLCLCLLGAPVTTSRMTIPRCLMSPLVPSNRARGFVPPTYARIRAEGAPSLTDPSLLAARGGGA